jgi:DNA-binding transcriptional LysR family regulator
MVDTLKRRASPIGFDPTTETTANLAEQIRRGAPDITFSTQPIQEKGLISKPLEAFETVFVGTRTMAPAPLELPSRHPDIPARPASAHQPAQRTPGGGHR